MIERMEELIRKEEPKIIEVITKSYARRFGVNVERLDLFSVTSHPTKSLITGVNVVASPGTTGEMRPSCIYQRVLKDTRRTSDDEGFTREDIRTEFERALVLQLLEVKNPARNVSLLPERYSKKTPEYNQEMISVREYIPKEDMLLEIAKKQNGGLKWTSSSGGKSIGDFMKILALQYVASKTIADALIRARVLDKGPGEVEPAQIASVHSGKFINRAQTLSKAAGYSLNETDKRRIGELLFPIYDRYFGTRGLQSVINGDLGTFPDHASCGRILDADAEVDACTLDFAVFSDFRFKNLWNDGKKEDPIILVRDLVIPSFFETASQYAEDLAYKIRLPEKDLTGLSFLLACGDGSFRAAPTPINYKILNGNGVYSIGNIETEVTNYLQNSYMWFKTFGEVAGKDTKRAIAEVWGILKDKGLELKNYRFSDEFLEALGDKTDALLPVQNNQNS